MSLLNSENTADLIKHDYNLPIITYPLRAWFPSVIIPALRAVAARQITAFGATAIIEDLINYCESADGRLDLLDMAPKTRASCRIHDPSQVHFHDGPGLNALWCLADLDAVILAGDPNWYTVFHALKLIDKAAAKAGRRFPLVLLHGVGWPHARCDGYTDPELIPDGFRQPWQRRDQKSISASVEPDMKLDLYPDRCHARLEGGPHNGVLTALDEFMAQSPALDCLVLPGWEGLALIYSVEQAREADFAALLAALHPSVIQQRLGETLEQARLFAMWQSVRKHRALETQQSLLADMRERLACSDAQNGSLNTRVQQLERSYAQMEDRCRHAEQARAELTAQLHEGERARAELAAQLHEGEQARAELAAQLREGEQARAELAAQLHEGEQARAELAAQLREGEQARHASQPMTIPRLSAPDPQSLAQTQRLREIEQALSSQTLTLRQYASLAAQLQDHFQATIASWRWRLGDRAVRMIELLLGRRQVHLAVDEMRMLFAQCERLRQDATSAYRPATQSVRSGISEPTDDLWSGTQHGPRPRLLLMPQRRGDRSPAASAHVRLLRPCFLPALTERWRVAVWPDGSLPAPGAADVLAIQREAAEIDLQTLMEWIGPWREAGGRLIYELDDDLLDREALTKRRHRAGDGSFEKYIHWLVSQADVVTVSTESLAEVIRPLNAHVAVIPNALDAGLWQLNRERPHPASGRKGPVRIGYIGTPAHDQDLAMVASALRRVEAEYGEAVVVEVIGACQNRKSPFGRVVPLPHKTEYPDFVRWLLREIKWDIGLIPLHDDRFNRSKSHLKFLEYAALNLAIVCSDAPAYADIACDGINALVVGDDEGAWYDAIKRLIEDADLRSRLAGAARAEVREGHVLESIVPHWLDVLDTLQPVGLTPLSMTAAADESGILATLARMARNPLPPAVVIPVYNAPDELRDCLDALLRHTPTRCRLIVIDDASPDPRITPLLDDYASRSPIEIYRNPHNLGFTHTVNRGLELADRADVVLLNADTQVTPSWLRNLRLAVYSGDRVATATPFSNNAGAFSAPEIGQANPLPDGFTLDAYARAVARQTRRGYPKTPTGNGFCLYLRRDALDAVGEFDATAFPRGYGEENDLCMRAVRLGWTHVVDDATFIFHVRSASFGAAKTDLMTQGRAIVDQRYPEYRKGVADFIGSRELLDAHQRIRRIPADWSRAAASIRPRLLFVVSTRTGGVPQTNRDLMCSLQGVAETLVLQGDPGQVELLRFDGVEFAELASKPLMPPLKAFPHRSAEYDRIVAEWLVQYAVEAIHIRHIAWHGLGLADVARGLGIPVIFSIHDFYPVCPTAHLIDDEQHFCAGHCTSGLGDCPRPLWREADFPLLKRAAIKDWRRHFATFLDKCDSFVTTSDSTRQLLIEHYPALGAADFRVIPHGRNFAGFEQLAAPFDPKGPIRLLIPGNIGIHKGAGILAELGRLAADARVEIHVLGKVSSVAKQAGTRIRWHGPYARDEFTDMVRAIRPHLGGVFSIWPETYCHTLTELWACGLPVIGFDLGAVGERIRESGGGWLTSTLSASDILETIGTLRTYPDRFAQALDAVIAWQNGIGRERDDAWMAAGYVDIYRQFVSLP